MSSFHRQDQRGPPKKGKKGRPQGKQLHAAMQINMTNSEEWYSPDESAWESVGPASSSDDDN